MKKESTSTSQDHHHHHHPSSSLSASSNESKSPPQSCASSSNSYTSTLTNKLIKLTENLFDLQELNYFPYNSCNSLTIYSYKYWQSQNKLLVSTKENNVKEISFKLAQCNETMYNLNDEDDDEDVGKDDTNADLSSANSSKTYSNEQPKWYLEPSFRIYKFPTIKSYIIFIRCMFVFI